MRILMLQRWNFHRMRLPSLAGSAKETRRVNQYRDLAMMKANLISGEPDSKDTIA